jgi:hypothetical protein
MIVIRVLLKDGEHIEFELGDDKKELDMVMRFHHGLDGNTVLNLKTSKKGSHSRIKVSEIKNMQHLKHTASKTPETDSHGYLDSAHDSKFKTREEYEKWKRQKIRENK